jgi:hypothetical protein
LTDPTGKRDMVCKLLSLDIKWLLFIIYPFPTYFPLLPLYLLFFELAPDRLLGALLFERWNNSGILSI